MKFVKKLLNTLKNSYVKFSKEQDELMLLSKNSPLVKENPCNPVSQFIAILIIGSFQLIFGLWFISFLFKIGTIILTFPFT